MTASSTTNVPPSTPLARACNVCGAALDAPIYVSPSAVSITSLCEVLDRPTEVFFCDGCGHLVTPPAGDLAAYYEDDYKILVDSEDEDQLYELGPDGKKTYRADHQLRRLLEKVPLPAGARLLDWGCAKGATFRRLAMLRPDLRLHLFDVSRMYERYWRRFTDPSCFATHVPPAPWRASFDLVTSFFSLEHVAEPRETMKAMGQLLAPNGRLYLIVPDLRRNTGDFVVADHVNHFTRASLSRLLVDAGLLPLELDETSHEGALIAIAAHATGVARTTPEAPVAALRHEVEALAAYWRGFGDRVRDHEHRHGDAGRAAIYGSGFYGTFIATRLRAPEAVKMFLDRNPFRQTQALLGRPIVAPEALPADVSLVYVGLNPARAREEIAKIVAWRDRPLSLFFP